MSLLNPHKKSMWGDYNNPLWQLRDFLLYLPTVLWSNDGELVWPTLQGTESFWRTEAGFSFLRITRSSTWRTVNSFLKNFLLFFWPILCKARGILVPWPGIKHVPPVLDVWSLNCGITREVTTEQQTLDNFFFEWKNKWMKVDMWGKNQENQNVLFWSAWSIDIGI